MISKEKKDIVLHEVKKAIESVGYGEVVISIHQKDVVQVEVREKKRF